MATDRIARNTVALFFRQAAIAVISLYTIRVLVAELGIEGFGFLSVANSVVGVFIFFSSALGTITQRYISFALGNGSMTDLKRYHDSCFLLALTGIVVTLVALNTVGLWFVNTHLVIPQDQASSVKLLYQFLIFYFSVNIITAFHAMVIAAHEDMYVFAMFSILGVLLRLGAALGIALVEAEGLILYGGLLFAGGLTVTLLQWVWCARRYEECRLWPRRADLATIREMIGFVSWTLYGNFTDICRMQALMILINQSFSPATVAARALAFTVYSQVQVFSQNFTSALNPPIIKAHAGGDRAQTFSLIFFGTKVTFFLSWAVALPLFALCPGILALWLGTYPEETVLFTRLMLIESVILSTGLPLMTAVHAVGQMRSYELLAGSLQILVLVVSWLLIRAGFPAVSVFLVAIAVNLLIFLIRLGLTVRLLGLSLAEYARAALAPVLMVACASSGLAALVLRVLPPFDGTSLGLAPVLGALAVIVIPVLSAFYLGFTARERDRVITLVRQKIGR